MEKPLAVILLSGGIDSATTAAVALDRGFTLHALMFNYGQKHGVELASAIRVAEFFNIPVRVMVEIPGRIFSSALTSREIAVPHDRPSAGVDDIPPTYVPGRNILFLSYGLSYAESVGARHIFIGANAVDYSGYPDCRPGFLSAFQAMANIGTRAGLEGAGFVIEAPLIDSTKAQIIRLGHSLGVDYAITHSCYDPRSDGAACGSCDSCHIRRRGFAEAGIPDPTRYADSATSR